MPSKVKGTLFDIPELAKVIEEIYRYPLRQSATDTLNRQMRAGISDDKLAELAMALRDEDRLCLIQEEEHSDEPQIICSLGLASGDTRKREVAMALNSSPRTSATRQGFDLRSSSSRNSAGTGTAQRSKSTSPSQPQLQALAEKRGMVAYHCRAA